MLCMAEFDKFHIKMADQIRSLSLSQLFAKGFGKHPVAFYRGLHGSLSFSWEKQTRHFICTLQV